MKKKLFGILFWILSLTWGIILTLPGLIITFVLIITGHKVYKNGCSYIVEVGGDWGGLEFGAVALCGNYYNTNRNWFEHTRRHEFGHNIQNIIFGPIQIIWSLCSAIRYWYRKLNPSKIHTKYDDFWVEGTATKMGYKMINYLEGETK